MIAVLVAVFIVSGAAGLIYESIWSRYLGLFVGHSAYAQIIVLVIFLGGMSLGAHHRRSRDRSGSARRSSGTPSSSSSSGVLALGFHDAFESRHRHRVRLALPGARRCVAVDGEVDASPALLILPQSILLGATFPLMSAGVIRMAREERRARPRFSGLLYFANSLGAAVGVLLAGFVLIERGRTSGHAARRGVP